jgi:hypothetical protein
MNVSRSALLAGAFLIASGMGAGQTWAAGDGDLRAELNALRRRVAELEGHLQTSGVSARKGPEVSLGGQYRINSYSADNDLGAGQQTASRVRIRQNVDFRFNESFFTHLQLELGHTTDNITTTNNSSRATNIAVRHAVLDYTLENGINLQAGIVPLSDRFGDTLFSSDWYYNPVAVSLTTSLGPGELRTFAGNLWEGVETDSADDFVHYQLDYALPLQGESQLNFGATLANVPDAPAAPGVPFSGHDRNHISYGVGGSFPLSDDVLVRAFVLGSHTDRKLLGTSDDAKGLAAKLEVTAGDFALLATHATGDSDGSGFLPVMALARTNGYWGYTGLLTVQGPTDTGFDGDSVNISNNGFGLTTVQAKYARTLIEDLDIHLAAGWFGNTDGKSGRDSFVGADFLAMATYRFTSFLALDLGGAYARLEDGLSGYSNGVIGGASYNQPLDRDRDKWAFFSRLQAEF